MHKQPAVYILSNRYHSVFYVGVTSNLLQRIYQHREHFVAGFTSQYNVDKWLYFEIFSDMENAIAREKKLKKWRRAWKVTLIESLNPKWEDLWDIYS